MKIKDYAIRGKDLIQIYSMIPFKIRNIVEYLKFRKNGKVGISMVVHLNSGLKFKIRTQDVFIFEELILRGEYEKYIKGTTILDLGSNIGCFAVIAASRGAKVYAVEACKSNYDLLCENIALNDYTDRIIPYHLAIWNKEGSISLSSSPKAPGGASVVFDTFSEEHEEVRSVNMNDFISGLKLNRIDVIKIDIEGAEAEALPTLSEDTMNRIDMIIGEYHSSRDGVSTFPAVVGSLKSHFNIVKTGFALFYATK